MKRLSIALIMALACILAGCGDNAPIVARTQNNCAIQGYGNGVFFFNCAGGFGPALAEFRRDHHVLSVTSFAFYNTGTTGYWVVTQ